MTNFKAFLPVFVVVAAAGCAKKSDDWQATHPLGPKIVITPSDVNIDATTEGKTVDVKVGQTIAWRVPVMTDAGEQADDPTLSSDGIVTFTGAGSYDDRPVNSPPMPGYSPDYRFNYKAVAEGDVDVTLQKYRFSKDKPSDLMKMHLHVTKA